MSYLALARKYRPATFADLIGQEAIARTIQGAIAADRVSHAYLLAGPRGVGKTTVARIMARALNCERGPTSEPSATCDCAICPSILAGNDLDFIEIDGASNRGIDEIREIRENARYRPARARYKIYLIDEVHMLTTPAFNALLKTLEEPPPHVKFFFATTEAHKLPDTIRSRCQRFDFRRIPPARIAAHLAHVCTIEGIEAEPAALAELARSARGALRDGLVRLDQVRAWCSSATGDSAAVTAASVHQILGTLSVSELGDWATDLAAGAIPQLYDRVDALYCAGADLEAFLEQWIEFLRGLLEVKACGVREDILLLGAADERLAKLAGRYTGDALLGLIGLFAETAQKLRTASLPRVLLELAFTRACTWDAWVSGDAVAACLRGQPPPASLGGRLPAARSAPDPTPSQAAADPSPAGLPAPREAPGPPIPTATPLPRAAVSPVAAPAAPAPREVDVDTDAQASLFDPADVPGPVVALPAEGAMSTAPAAASDVGFTEDPEVDDEPDTAPASVAAPEAPAVPTLATRWPDVVAHLGDAMQLDRPLLLRARVSAERGKVILRFADANDAFGVRRIQGQPAKIRALADAVAHVTGERVAIEIELPTPATAAPRKTHQQVAQDPYVRSLIEVFGGQIVDIRPSEELPR